MRVARTTLQQVFQNLILNAAEAVREPGGTRHAAHQRRPRGDPSGQQLHIVYGRRRRHPPEHLPRIFEKGFSTKSPATNSGIGLHWSANAVAALGGSIRAARRGPVERRHFPPHRTAASGAACPLTGPHEAP